MPRYELKDVIITSYNTSGSKAHAESEPPPVVPTLPYTTIDFDYSRDEFDFVSGGGESEKPKFEWIEIKPPPKPPGPWQTNAVSEPDYDLADASDMTQFSDDVFMF